MAKTLLVEDETEMARVVRRELEGKGTPSSMLPIASLRFSCTTGRVRIS
jgi:CheY-like chemotaxis protein